MSDTRTHITQKFIEALPHSKALGMVLTEVGDGRAAIEMAYDPVSWVTRPRG